MIDVKACPGFVVPLGRVGENNSRRIVFDVSWLSDFPGADLILYNRRVMDEDAYPVFPDQMEIIDGKLYWTVTSADVAAEGSGKCQVAAYLNGAIVKSEIYHTVCLAALDKNQEPPAPWVSWQRELVALAQNAVDASSAAQASEQAAETAGESAAGDADLAEESARNAALDAERAEQAKTATEAAREAAEAAERSVETKANAAIQDIATAGTEQVAAVEQKGAEVRQSIPSDYTELSEDVGELKDTIFEVSGSQTLISGIPGITKVSGTVTGITTSNPAGIKLSANANYDTYYMPVSKSTSIAFASLESKYISLCVAENYSGISSGGNVLIGENGVRYRKSESNLPGTENPLIVEAGSVIAFSVTAGSDEYVYGFAESLAVKTNFADEVVKTAGAKKRPIISYTTAVDSSGSYGQEQLSVFLPAKSGYVKYAFIRCESNSKNANSWRIDQAIACDDELVNRYSLTTSGEWEMALHAQDAPDFTGGIAHGDEVFTSFDVIVDGQHISDITSLQGLEFTNCVIKETSLLYNPIDGATLETREQFTPIGTHGRVYRITADGIRLMQEVTFDTDITLVQSYMTMLPMIRGNDAVSAEQITDHYFANNDYTTYDVSVGGSGAGYGWKPNVTMAHIWGNTSGVLASVEMMKQPDIENAGTKLFQVQSTIDSYNKLYWSVCGVSNHPYSVASGERFVTDTMYKIDVAL